MAGLKKKKKEKSSSPNLALVIFLVLFVLTSIGLGVWGYYGYAGQEDLRNQKRTADSIAKGEKFGKLYYQMLWRDLRQALGDKLDANEEQELNLERDDFLADGFGKYKDEATKETAKKLRMDLRSVLDVADNGKDYRTNYAALLDNANKTIKTLDGTANAEAAKHKATKDLFQKLSDSQNDAYKDGLSRIDKGNAVAKAESQKRFDEFKAAQANNAKLNEELRDKAKEIADLKDEHENKIKLMMRQIKTLEAERRELAGLGAGGAANQMVSGASFPLLLDISPGKPLWDHPVGKVTSVNLDQRQVVINVGSTHGVRPELTFNIFGANSAGRAEKSLKGSIEVIKVLDTNSSLARITSLYDPDGIEINLSSATRGRILRETDAPIREGDLLFNLFWGSRVAVTGYVSLLGEPSDNPAEQIRQMEDFMYLLKRNGVQVDAYVDLRDGQIRGNISSKTRYLIRGDDLLTMEERQAPKMADDEKEPAAKEPAEKEGQVNADRNGLINLSSKKLREDAKSLGLLLISAENFATVVGFRKARNANSPELSSFTPSLPYAGSVDAGVVRQAPPREEEKKAPEMEKKDDQ